MNSAIAAAHIITADAEALGDPAIVIMTRADETGAADLIDEFTDADTSGDLGGELIDRGWRPVEPWTAVERGYWIVNVVKA